MCGIAGFVESSRSWSYERLVRTAKSMGYAVAHRGPDDDGVWADGHQGVALAHRRLSIVDLSKEGHQPMKSGSGRYVLVLNGEIYNYRCLRKELDSIGESPTWRGQSDTEIFLAACDAWGIRKAVERSNGMFAIAIWDVHERELVMVRDRMGEKPLYYGFLGEIFAFGSELKALEVHPRFTGKLHRKALASYLRFGYVPAPLSIYEGVRKLEPGMILRISFKTKPCSEAKERYWHVPVPSAPRLAHPERVIDQLHGVLRAAVKLRMHADVPLGAFLSGGIDSSIIVALMQELAGQQIRTYSIGVSEKRHNEAVHASAVANALGTHHEELYVSASDALAVIPKLSEVYDEPFADSSQIPTLLLSQLTRDAVTVALSGDGGDELFGGYVRYLQARRLSKFTKTVPRSFRGLMACGLERIAGPGWDHLLALGPESLAVTFGSDRMQKLAGVLGSEDYRQMYAVLVSQWRDLRAIAPGLASLPGTCQDEELDGNTEDPESWMMHMDQLTYLPDDILVKVDRASMAVALETRVPFLDHNVVHFAADMPLALKIKDGKGKWALRQVLYRYLDRKIVDRPKQGFAIPISTWLRGPLRQWAEDLLSESALAETGIFDPKAIRATWHEHLAGRRSNPHRLWVILMLQGWLRRVSTHTAKPVGDMTSLS